MILTVTMNPSIDMSYSIDHLRIDDVNRVSNVSKTAGGKGLNVSRVLHLLNAPLESTGIIGGHLGDLLEELLDKDDINHKFFRITPETRNCLAILHDNGKQTEILEAGPKIQSADAHDFLDFFNRLSRDVKIVTMSGSLLQGVAPNFYNQMVHIVHKNNGMAILDTSGASLQAAVTNDEKPDLIKPNEEELQNLVGKSFNAADPAEIKTILQEPIFDGIEWIVISLGAKGCVAKHNHKFYDVTIPKINVVNPVGSEDSTIAGLAYAINEEKSDAEILRYGMTTGMLNTMERKTGFINPTHLEEYLSKVQVEEF